MNCRVIEIIDCTQQPIRISQDTLNPKYHVHDMTASILYNGLLQPSGKISHLRIHPKAMVL